MAFRPDPSGAGLGGLDRRDFTRLAAMADQWWNTSTYTHVLLIPAILAWLVWQRRDQARIIMPVCWLPGLAFYLGAALVWVLGTLAGVAEVAQFGAVGC
jgi:hypothetical protein